MNILNLKSPDIFNPVPSLQEQTHKALNLPDPASIGPQDDIQPGDTTPDPTNIDYLMRSKNYNTAIEAILDSAKPQPDPEKEKRLKQRAAIGAIGDAFRQVFSGVNMAKGYNVKPENMNTAPTDALTNYMDKEEAKRLQWNNMLTQAKIHGLNYSEQMKDAADQMRYNIWKTKQDNALKARDYELDKWYKTTSLDAQTKEAIAKRLQDKEIKMAEIQQRKNESDQDYKARMAMVAASRYNATLDYEASKNKSNGINDDIEFVNPGTGQIDRIASSSATYLINNRKAELEKEYSENGYVNKYKLAQEHPEYELMQRYQLGGLNKEEKRTLMNMVYSRQSSLKHKQYSQNDWNGYSSGTDPYTGKKLSGSGGSNETQSQGDDFVIVGADGKPK